METKIYYKNDLSMREDVNNSGDCQLVIKAKKCQI